MRTRHSLYWSGVVVGLLIIAVLGQRIDGRRPAAPTIFDGDYQATELATKLHALLDPEFGPHNVAVAITCATSSVTTVQTTVAAPTPQVDAYRSESYDQGGHKYSKQETRQSFMCPASTTSTVFTPDSAHHISCSIVLHADVSPSDMQSLQQEIETVLDIDPAEQPRVSIRTTRVWNAPSPYRTPVVGFAIIVLVALTSAGCAWIAPRARDRSSS